MLRWGRVPPALRGHAPGFRSSTQGRGRAVGRRAAGPRPGAPPLRAGFVLPPALCRRGGTGNPWRLRQSYLLLQSWAHDGGSCRSRGEQRREQQQRYLQHWRGGEDEAPFPGLRRRRRRLHQQVAAQSRLREVPSQLLASLPLGAQRWQAAGTRPRRQAGPSAGAQIDRPLLPAGSSRRPLPPRGRGASSRRGGRSAPLLRCPQVAVGS